MTDAGDTPTLAGLRGGMEEPGAMGVGRHGTRDASPCATSAVPLPTVDVSGASAPFPPHHPVSRAGVRDAGSGTAGADDPASRTASKLAAVAPRIAAGSSVPLPSGTEWHSPSCPTLPKSLILHAPRLIRTADLLIRSRHGAHQFRGVSRTSGAARRSRAQAKHPETTPSGTEVAQSYFGRKFFIARPATTPGVCRDPSPVSERGAGLSGGPHG